MVKLFLMFATLLLIASIYPEKIYSREKNAQSSALLSSQYTGRPEPDIRIMALENILKRHNSPLATYAKVYVQHADRNNIDWKLLPAISGIESTFGKHYVAGSYNAYGWGGGYIYFKSWEDGIATISEELKLKYVNRGADTIYKIAPIYAPPSTSWAYGVSSFSSEISKEYLKLISENLTPSI